VSSYGVLRTVIAYLLSSGRGLVLLVARDVQGQLEFQSATKDFYLLR